MIISKKNHHLLYILFAFLLHTYSYGQFSTLMNFDGNSNGMNPRGSLLSVGPFMYGMTQSGGLYNYGTVFKILPDGTGYEKLLDFDGINNGSAPIGSLYFDGNYLYGMTGSGGVNNKGSIFKILPDGTGYFKLFDFSGVIDGSYPWGTLVSDGTYLYGTAHNGGVNNLGTIFRILPSGSGFEKLLDFAGPTNGSYPVDDLYFDGTFLYGMTTQGGIADKGIIYKIMPDGSGFVKIREFDSNGNGWFPFGSLISDGTYLYGMTWQGGNYNLGIIFKMLPDGTSFVKIKNFSGSQTGNYPEGALLIQGGYLYGMTQFGGNNNLGTIFKLLPDGTAFEKLLDFDGSINGSLPYGSLISDGNFLYGMTSEGGSNGFGLIFKQCIPPVVSASNTGPYCSGSTIELNASGGDGYVWDGPLSFSSTAQNPAISFSTVGMAGLYTAIVNNTVGCISEISTYVEIDSLPTANNTGPYCAGTTIQLNAEGGGNYFWSGPLSFSNGTQNPVIPVSTTDMSGAYVLTATNACGTNSASTNVTVNSLPTVTASNTGAYCVGQTIELNASGGGSYLWNGPLSFTSSTQNPTISPASMAMNGTYTVTVTNAEGCTSQGSTNVIINTCASVEELSQYTINIFPNPTMGIISISVSANLLENVSIFNSLGQDVLNTEMFFEENQSYFIDLSMVTSGFYILKIGDRTQRIIRL